MTSTETIESYSLDVPVAGAGQRLDRWLASQLDLSRSRIQSLIFHGKVERNGGLCNDKKTALQAGDRIYLEVPPPLEVDLRPEAIPLDILYEDDELLVLDKPKGMVVHPSAGHPSGTLVNALLAHCKNLSGINGERRPGIVHRLDKDTSGALVVAKSDRAHQHLQAQIQAKTARREYLGVVFGRPRQTSGTIIAAIGRHPHERKKMAVVPADKGRHAVTHWTVLEPLGNYTLMHYQLETGRTHQIRVHSAHIGHPLVGDPTYTHSRTTPVTLSGQALHAWKLSFKHPVTGEAIAIEAPPPAEFERLLNRLRQQ
ncbi:RluA family pseudouridine synthase [Synechococcus sp. PCC 7336]|uniref:RluA family pseudouridine synthase n=1 Tax=Synechococcus sp. PCC 7336 TaxID=195250 RepID=UPI00034A15E8|nr:RluA family pseudouridine synthase [Synechococcus sp. PCC 7336]